MDKFLMLEPSVGFGIEIGISCLLSIIIWLILYRRNKVRLLSLGVTLKKFYQGFIQVYHHACGVVYNYHRTLVCKHHSQIDMYLHHRPSYTKFLLLYFHSVVPYFLPLALSIANISMITDKYQVGDSVGARGGGHWWIQEYPQ